MAEQMSLIYDGPLARKTDPETSHEAARKIKRSGELNKQQREVLAALKQYPNCTAVELAKNARLDRHKVSRRLPDLEKAGKVKRYPSRICTVNGTNMAVWGAL